MPAPPSKDCAHRPYFQRFPAQIMFPAPSVPESIPQATAVLRTSSPPFLVGFLNLFVGIAWKLRCSLCFRCPPSGSGCTHRLLLRLGKNFLQIHFETPHRVR